MEVPLVSFRDLTSNTAGGDKSATIRNHPRASSASAPHAARAFPKVVVPDQCRDESSPSETALPY